MQFASTIERLVQFGLGDEDRKRLPGVWRPWGNAAHRLGADVAELIEAGAAALEEGEG